jgi:uncharacterized membrane protein YhiD involved in acid resistance|tara:strand:+ start:1339 stop:1776 length:438 start_codon:yes stop_codon:yes gene_type:complete
MFGFIAFGFKLLFAAIAGGALSYIPGEETQNYKIVETSLICIFGAAILGLTSQLNLGEFNIVTGIGILAVIIGIISISKNLDFVNRMVWLFSGVSGMIIGAGYIVQALLLVGLIYLILRNSDDLLDYFGQETEKPDDGSIENISN